ncbi:MAG: RagB/SusD family nutrient uptake outer membrane protein [Polaribacter sp.]
MKKIFKFIILIVVVSMTTNGCSYFLEEEVFSTSQTDIVFDNLDSAQSVMLSLYALLGDNTASTDGESGVWTGNGGNDYLSSSNTDECIVRPQNSASSDGQVALMAFRSNTPQIRATWVAMYQGIFLANTILQNIETTPATSDADIVQKNEIIAHTKFMRGFYYFYLMTYYGGVPLVTIPESYDPESLPKRASVQEVSEFIENEWLAALDDIPNNDMTDDGRVGKMGIYAYLAKLNIYMASMKRYGTGTNIDNIGGWLKINSFDWVDDLARYNKVKEYTDAIYSVKGDNLTSVFQHLFITATETNTDVRSEMLFGINFSPIRPRRMQNEFLFRGNSLFGGGAGSLRPTAKIFYLMNQEFDVRFNTNLMGRPLNGRRDGRIVYNGITYIVPDPVRPRGPLDNNYHTAKYRNPAKNEEQYPNLADKDTDINQPLIRYADILLMRAEASYELNGQTRTQEVTDMLNLVRGRALGLDTSDPNYTTNLQALNTEYFRSDVILELLEERIRELAFEGWRRFDLTRTHRYQEMIEGLVADNYSNFMRPQVNSLKDNFAPFKMWYPIPLIEVGSGDLTQNPGF